MRVVGEIRIVNLTPGTPPAATNQTRRDYVTLAAMPFDVGALRGSARGVVDHRLARRHLINEYHRGRLRIDQVCDVHPELLRAAKNVGEETSVTCPICEDEKLRLVTYVFGPKLPPQGRCVSDRKEMTQLNRRAEDLAAYIVECCIACKWHHLLRVMPVGGKRPRSTPATPPQSQATK
jgi:Family of unknown function (DUF5318)